jgi:hypothetical protein
MSARPSQSHARTVVRGRLGRRVSTTVAVIALGGVVAPLVASGASSDLVSDAGPTALTRAVPSPVYNPRQLGMFGGFELDVAGQSLIERWTIAPGDRLLDVAAAPSGPNLAARPLPTTVPDAMAVAVDEALAAAAELERVTGLLLETYGWDERSLRVADLQLFLGVEVDGWYAGATRGAHLGALAFMELPNDHVPTPPPPRQSATRGGPSESAWAALRRCEASGNYSAVSRSGRYRGAYQFDQTTWNDVARRHHSHLVGRDPARASRGDQDMMARTLYNMRGAQPWPVCGRHLR